MTTRTQTIGFIGTGVMGSSMAGHLMDAGYDLQVFNRSKDKAAELLSRGARWAESAGEAAVGADVVITIVGYPSDVEEVYLGAGGIIERAEPGTVIVDMTTSSPKLAEKIAVAASQRGLVALDAPVSGGDIGARNATLTIMVGGDEATFTELEPVFSAMGACVVRQGGPGAGQHTKMANQVAIAGTMLSTVEALAYAQANGLDPARVLESIGAGSATSWSLVNYSPRILRGDFGPGFYIKHFVKDLRIATAAAEECGITLPGLDLARRLYERLESAGGAELGTQALWLMYASAHDRIANGVDVAAGVQNA